MIHGGKKQAEKKGMVTSCLHAKNNNLHLDIFSQYADGYEAA